ncbi:MAG: hypothetical protein MUC42_02310 [Bryobacter sp.]|nr:hypothetical protein [Bryobacter sp.]
MVQRFLLVWCTVSLAAAQVAILPLAEVRPGLRATGKTVFESNRIEEFQAEILGVLEDVGPGQSIILARLSGGPLERTGVLQGMSGSPVYANGKLLGAVALAFPLAKEPIAGIRPIEEMLAAGAAAPSPAQAGIRLTDEDLTRRWQAKRAAIPWEGRSLMEIATPVSLSGFSARTLEVFGPQLRALGLEPRQGPAAGRGGRGAAALVPGGMISVQLMTGDMTVGADGTVTAIEGNRIHAFGHRFLASGPSELPFAQSEVITLLPSLSTSFKISKPGEWLGTITEDRNAAIVGELGRRAPMTPVRVRLDNGRQRLQFQMEMVRHRFLAPFLFQLAMFSALDGVERGLGPATVNVRGTVELEGGLPPLKLENSYAGDFSVPLVASLSTALPLAYLLDQSFEGTAIRSIDLELRAWERKRQWRIDDLWCSRRMAQPGEEIEIGVVLTGDGGAEELRKVRYRIPLGATPGPLQITVADGMTTNAIEMSRLFAPSFGGPPVRNAAQMVGLLNQLRPNNRAYVRIWRPEAGFPVGALDLAGVPSSLNLLLAKTQTTTLLSTAGVRWAELPVDAGDYVVSGTRSITIEVKE